MTAPQPAPGTAGAARVPDHALRAGLVAGAAYALVGWRALLVPSLILFVAPAFGQADAGMGAYYLATALAYGVGALFGGRFIRRFGARLILPSAAALMAAGLLIQGFTGAWIVFALAGVFTTHRSVLDGRRHPGARAGPLPECPQPSPQPAARRLRGGGADGAPAARGAGGTRACPGNG